VSKKRQLDASNLEGPASPATAETRNSQLTRHEVRAFLVRAPNWIGDAVMSLGGLREVRRIAGGAHVAVAAKPWVAGIYEETGVVDEIIPVERRSWRDAIATSRALRGRRFDVAVLFQNAFEAALVARLGRARRVVGYPTDGRRLLLTDVVPLPPGHRGEHQSRYYMRIAEGLEVALTGSSRVDVTRPDVSLEPSARTRAIGAELLAERGVEPGEPVAVLNPGATNSRAKQWAPERFAAVGDALAAQRGGRVAIIGSGAERETSERVAKLMRNPSRAVVLAGRTTITGLVGVLAHAWALVSNDTGPAHLGAALGIPTVTIFGPTEQWATHPVGPRAATVSNPVECSPCMLRDCPIDHRCMTGVRVETVLGALAKVADAA
jgi:heptosyltransferase-2